MFKALAAFQYSFSSAKVYVIRGHVAKGFVIPPRVVVGDKPREPRFIIACTVQLFTFDIMHHTE